MNETTDFILQMAIVIVPFMLIYYFMMLPQKKRDKAITQMRNQLALGDRVITIGGIIGKVVNIKDDAITIETGTEKNRMRVMRWAIQTREGASSAAPASAEQK